MANRYWVGDGGNWSDNTNHWSASSGGAPGASLPTSNDDVFFDVSSFSIGGQNVTLDVFASCKGFTSSGILNNPSVSGGYIDIRGSLFLDGGMLFTGSGIILRGWQFSTFTVTTNGTDLSSTYFQVAPAFASIGAYTLNDNLVVGLFTVSSRGIFNANGFDVSASSFQIVATTSTVDMGSGTWTIREGSFSLGYTFGTSTIISSNTNLVVYGGVYGGGVIDLVGGGIPRSWNSVTLTSGSSSAFYRDNGGGATVTIGTFTFNSTAGGTAYFGYTDAGISFNIGTLNLNGTPESFITVSATLTFLGEGTAIINAGVVNLSYVKFIHIQAGGAAAPWTGIYLLDGGGNSGIILVPNSFSFYLQNTLMVAQDTNGTVQNLNVGKADDGTPIYYELETQDLEFKNRLHLKKIADKIVVFTDFGTDSKLEAKTDEGGYDPVRVDLSGRVNIGKDINLEGHYFTFKWFGESVNTSPVFEGISLEDVTDLGMTYG